MTSLRRRQRACTASMPALYKQCLLTRLQQPIDREPLSLVQETKVLFRRQANTGIEVQANRRDRLLAFVSDEIGAGRMGIEPVGNVAAEYWRLHQIFLPRTT